MENPVCYCPECGEDRECIQLFSSSPELVQCLECGHEFVDENLME